MTDALLSAGLSKNDKAILFGRLCRWYQENDTICWYYKSNCKEGLLCYCYVCIERQEAPDVEMTHLMEAGPVRASGLQVTNATNRAHPPSDDSVSVRKPPRKKQCSNKNRKDQFKQVPFSLRIAEQDYTKFCGNGSDSSGLMDERDYVLAFQRTPHEINQANIHSTLQSLHSVVAILTQRRQRKHSNAIESIKSHLTRDCFETSIVDSNVNLPSLRQHLMHENMMYSNQEHSGYDSGKNHQDVEVRHRDYLFIRICLAS